MAAVAFSGKTMGEKTVQTLIAGRWRDASGPTYSTEYPHDGSTVATLHAATAADVDEAVRAAELARHQPDWAGLKPHDRAAILHRIAAGIRARGEELAQLQRLDNGKPIRETRALWPARRAASSISPPCARPSRTQ